MKKLAFNYDEFDFDDPAVKQLPAPMQQALKACLRHFIDKTNERLDEMLAGCPEVFTDELKAGVWSDVRERFLDPATHKARLVNIEPLS